MKTTIWRIGVIAVVSAVLLAAPAPVRAQKKDKRPTRSTTIALFKQGKMLLVANRETDTVSVLTVRR